MDWRASLPTAGFVELPTYAFERKRFWLSGDGAAVDAAGLGLGASEHALLGAVVELPDSGGVVLTGRLSTATQSWLTDHAVEGVAVFPGAGFVELAIRAGDEVGCATVDELNLQSPLLLPASGSVAVQVVVGAAGESGQRSLSVFARETADSAWNCHATGILSSGPVEPAADLSVWPPEGAIAVDVTDGYQRLAERGYQYGPAFQGLTALWRRGEEFFAEVTLPQAAGGVTGFGVHPVLLDAALHAAAVTHDGAGVALPFSWQGVSLHAAGAAAVRARIAPSGPSAVSVELADGLGLPVLTVSSMVARPISQQQLAAAISGAVGDRLFELAWSPAVGSVAAPRRRPTRCSNLLWLRAIRSRRATNGCIRRWRRCNPGSPNTSRASWWCRPAARWGCRARTSPILPVPPSGGWCARHRPSIRAASFWWIPMRH